MASIRSCLRVAVKPPVSCNSSLSALPLAGYRAFSILNRPPPKYEGHVPLTTIERAGLAVGSALWCFFDPTRAGMSDSHCHSTIPTRAKSSTNTKPPRLNCSMRRSNGTAILHLSPPRCYARQPNRPPHPPRPPTPNLPITGPAPPSLAPREHRRPQLHHLAGPRGRVPRHTLRCALHR